MKKLPILSFIFLVLSAACFTGAGMRKYKADKEAEEIKRSYSLETVYYGAQLCVTDRYAAKGEIMDDIDEEIGWYVITGLPEGFNIVTVKEAPLIDYVEYNGHKYPEVDKDSDIYCLADDVKDFNRNAEKYARETIAPMIYAAAYRYIRQNYDKTKGCDTISPEELIEKVDFFEKEPKKTAYIKDRIDSVRIRLSNDGSKVRYIAFDGYEYAPISGWWSHNAENYYDYRKLGEKIYTAAWEYANNCLKNGNIPKSYSCETLVSSGFLDEMPPTSADICIDVTDKGLPRRVWVDTECYPYFTQ